MNGPGPGNFFTRDENKIFAPVRREFNGLGIDKYIVLAQDQKIVIAVEIPLRHRFRRGVRVAAQDRMYMGIAAEPLIRRI